MIIEGSVWKFGDDIDTDQIIPTQYLTLPTLKEMSNYAMEPQDPQFAQKYRPNDIIAGGKNFGCGSSREQAPAILKELGVKVIIAESFARIFFRNCINLGILLVEVEDTTGIKTGDTLQIDTAKSVVYHNEQLHRIAPLSDFLKEILKKGGLKGYIGDY